MYDRLWYRSFVCVCVCVLYYTDKEFCVLHMGFINYIVVSVWRMLWILDEWWSVSHTVAVIWCGNLSQVQITMQCNSQLLLLELWGWLFPAIICLGCSWLKCWEVLCTEKKLPQCHFIHHKFHLNHPGTECGKKAINTNLSTQSVQLMPYFKIQPGIFLI
jgi:hypothetical protein